MTQAAWKISEAKALLSEVVQASGESPQLLYSRGKPETQRPSMAALLAELDGINQSEADFGDPPPRANRPQPDFD